MEIRILFITFALVILWIADNELLAQICRLALFYGNSVYCVFLLMYWKLGTSKESQKGTRWALTPCVYIHGTNAPFRQERVHIVLSIYTSLGVGFCTYILWILRFPNTSIHKGWPVQNSYAISIYRENILYMNFHKEEWVKKLV